MLLVTLRGLMDSRLVEGLTSGVSTAATCEKLRPDWRPALPTAPVAIRLTAAHPDGPLAFTVKPTRSFETLVSRLFRDRVQFCSGLVDLVVGVGGYLGGAHRLALARERFVVLVGRERCADGLS